MSEHRFIGGPLDGELRPVSQKRGYIGEDGARVGTVKADRMYRENPAPPLYTWSIMLEAWVHASSWDAAHAHLRT